MYALLITSEQAYREHQTRKQDMASGWTTFIIYLEDRNDIII